MYKRQSGLYQIYGQLEIRIWLFLHSGRLSPPYKEVPRHDKDMGIGILLNSEGVNAFNGAGGT